MIEQDTSMVLQVVHSSSVTWCQDNGSENFKGLLEATIKPLEATKHVLGV